MSSNAKWPKNKVSASASGGKAMGVGIEKRAVSTVDDAKRKRGRR